MKEILAVFVFSFVILFSLGFEVANANFMGAPLPNIYINEDGSIEPKTAPIQRNGNIYTLTADIIKYALVIECDNIVVDGKGYMMQGTGVYWDSPAITLQGGNYTVGRQNVTIKNFVIAQFQIGIHASHLSNSAITKNSLHCNSAIITGSRSYRNLFSYNTLLGKYNDMGVGISVGGSYNSAIGNNISTYARGIVFIKGDHNRVSSNLFTNTAVSIDTKYAPDTVLENNVLPVASPSPTPTSNPTPTQAVPEFSLLAILPLFITLLFIAVKLRHQKTPLPIENLCDKNR